MNMKNEKCNNCYEKFYRLSLKDVEMLTTPKMKNHINSD